MCLFPAVVRCVCIVFMSDVSISSCGEMCMYCIHVGCVYFQLSIHCIHVGCVYFQLSMYCIHVGCVYFLSRVVYQSVCVLYSIVMCLFPAVCILYSCRMCLFPAASRYVCRLKHSMYQLYQCCQSVCVLYSVGMCVYFQLSVYCIHVGCVYFSLYIIFMSDVSISVCILYSCRMCLFPAAERGSSDYCGRCRVARSESICQGFVLHRKQNQPVHEGKHSAAFHSAAFHSAASWQHFLSSFTMLFPIIITRKKIFRNTKKKNLRFYC